MGTPQMSPKLKGVVRPSIQQKAFDKKPNFLEFERKNQPDFLTTNSTRLTTHKKDFF
jgi:hypothetical protein